MTANERFFALGWMEEFDSAARRRDRNIMIEIYRDAEVSNPEECVATILANPERYGF